MAGDGILSRCTSRKSRSWPPLYVCILKSPVKHAGNRFSHVAHLNLVFMETAFLSRWFYSLKCLPRSFRCVPNFRLVTKSAQFSRNFELCCRTSSYSNVANSSAVNSELYSICLRLDTTECSLLRLRWHPPKLDFSPWCFVHTCSSV